MRRCLNDGHVPIGVFADSPTQAHRWIDADTPGIFAIGYTIGTGSVTSMAKAGLLLNAGLAFAFIFSASLR